MDSLSEVHTIENSLNKRAPREQTVSPLADTSTVVLDSARRATAQRAEVRSLNTKPAVVGAALFARN